MYVLSAGLNVSLSLSFLLFSISFHDSSFIFLAIVLFMSPFVVFPFMTFCNPSSFDISRHSCARPFIPSSTSCCRALFVMFLSSFSCNFLSYDLSKGGPISCLLWVNSCLAKCLNGVLCERAGLVYVFNQEKTLVWAFSVIVKLQFSRSFVSSSIGHILIHYGWGTLVKHELLIFETD